MKTEVVLIFDIGKTNKKVLIFDRQLHILHEEETIFEEMPDDDGYSGDDIEKIEDWIFASCEKHIADNKYILKGINFTTYGATLMYLNEKGERLTPVYNYLKTMPGGIVEPLYTAFGGEDEFCRNTASPALGMLNSGFQALWLKSEKPEIFKLVKSILHFPQYLSFLFTGAVSSEHTSIGCHTALWDFDNMAYHVWTKELGNTLPDPVSVEATFPSKKIGKDIPVGIGIHDSSSSLVPYFMNSEEEFILVSTGTWCISMNPFNAEPLTANQLKNDCLAYMSIQKKPVKSSRLFMGRIHDVNVKHLNQLFGTADSAYKTVALDEEIIRRLNKKSKGARVFFNGGVPVDYVDTAVGKENFNSFEEAYHRLVIDLVHLTKESIDLVIGKIDHTKNIYISGGFSKNPIFLKLMASCFPDKKVYTSEVANATSLGAAMVLWKGINPSFNTAVNLGLKSFKGDPSLMG
jgi:sugar (pentulose or hexulose) kinase